MEIELEGIKDYILPKYLRSLKIKEKKPDKNQKTEDRAGFLILGSIRSYDSCCNENVALK